MIWPRQHALKIILMDSKKERRDYIANEVPPIFRDWVSYYVQIWWGNREKIRNNFKGLPEKPNPSDKPIAEEI